MKLKDVSSIGVLKFRNIGDVLMMTPALRALRETFPRARITAAVNRGTEEMLSTNASIDHLMVLDRPRPGATRAERLRLELDFLRRLRAESFDLVVDYTSGDRAAFYSFLSGARHRLAYRTKNVIESRWKKHLYTHLFDLPSGPCHEVEKDLRLVSPLGIRSELRSLELNIPDAAAQWAQETVAPAGQNLKIHLHPVSRWLFKCWDEEKMATLMDRLHDELDARIFLTSSREDRELAMVDRILRRCRHPVVNLAGKTTLLQTAALSRSCAMYVGVDTAPMHMAAAVDVPVIALFGPTGADAWHPWCHHYAVIQKPCRCNADRTMHCVHDAVRDCMKAIEVDDVIEAVRQMVRCKPQPLPH